MTIVNDGEGLVQLSPNEALELILPELQKISQTDLEPLNIDPFTASSTVQAALPRIRELRPDIERLLVEFDLDQLDRLEIYSLALIQCHALYLSVKAPPEELKAVITETSRIRSLLRTDLDVLVKHGVISGLPAEGIRRNKAHKSIANDILVYVNLMRAHWNAVSHQCGTSQAELQRAEALAVKLIRMLGYRDRTPQEVSASNLQRRRAFTLFVRAYDEVRRAVTYVRWHRGDADRIAPSLYGGKHVTRKKPAPPLAETPPKPTPEQDPFLN